MSVDELPEDLRELAGLLDEMGAVEREVLREACGDGASEFRGTEGLRGTEGRTGERGARGGPRPLWYLLPLVAAAGLLWIALRPDPTPDPVAGDSPRLLSGGGVTLLETSAAPGEVLRWSFPGEGSLVFDVRVLDPEARPGAAPLFRARVRTREVQLPADRSVPWPDPILLEIDVLDEGGRVLDSFEQELSSRR
ncbi:MAG TPA: hypothetical protein ENJ09_06965 [Planctomycetes bacterium]|nr:hypothetical protein [Planctomycetota bacterium]